MEKDNNKLVKTSIYSSIFLIIILLIGFSLAFFTMSEEARLRIRGNIQDTFIINLVTPQGAYINASNIEPILAKDINTLALRTNFSVVTGNNHHNVNYDLSMKDMTITNNLITNEFKWRLVRNNNTVASGTFASVDSNQLRILTNESIAPNSTHQYEFLMWIESVGQTQNHLLGGTVSGRFSIEGYMGRETAKDQILALNPIKTGADFTIIANNLNRDTQEGIFEMHDDHGTAYIFRGTHNTLNNNVIFAGHQWKILRIEGNGNIRMIYNGRCSGPLVGTTGATVNTETCLPIRGNTAAAAATIGTSAFNSNAHMQTFGLSSTNQDSRFVGFMHGSQQGVCTTFNNCHSNQTNSTIKRFLETWLNNTSDISTANRSMIANDAVFCSDRSLQSGNGVGQSQTQYQSFSRVSGTGLPILTCPRPEDQIINPIGLLTIDEKNIAGGRGLIENQDYYLRINGWYWTLSPAGFISSSIVAAVRGVDAVGSQTYNSVSPTNLVRPVISLRSDVKFSSGDGSLTNPFRVE